MHLMGQPLSCSAASAGKWGERGYGERLHTLEDSAVSPFSLAAWLSSTCISMISPLTSPQFVSPQSTAALSLGLLHSPLSPAPSCCAFQETSIPVQGMCVCGKDCLIFIPFRLPQISCFPLGLKCFSSDSDNCPDVGIRPLLQFPAAEGRSSPTNTPVFPPSSFILPSFAWFYIFFSTG